LIGTPERDPDEWEPSSEKVMRNQRIWTMIRFN